MVLLLLAVVLLLPASGDIVAGREVVAAARGVIAAGHVVIAAGRGVMLQLLAIPC